MMCNGLAYANICSEGYHFDKLCSRLKYTHFTIKPAKNIELTLLAKSLSHLLHLSLFNPLTPKISLVILLTVCHTVLAS